MRLPSPLDRLELGTILGFCRTAGHHPFFAADGELHEVSLWFVVSTERCWLVAATATATFVYGHPSARLDKGWTWDAVVVGARSAPLRTGTRAELEALLELAGRAPPRGEEVAVVEEPLASEREDAAPGAEGVPAWIDAEVPATSPWLFAYETQRSHGFAGVDGSVERVSTWVAIGVDQAVLTARHGGEFFVRPVEKGRVVEGRPMVLIADGWKLPGALINDRKTGWAGRYLRVQGAARWAVAGDHALHRGQPNDAVKLTRAAFLRGEHAHLWPLIAKLAWAAGDRRGAVRAAAQCEDLEPWDPIKAATVGLPSGLFAELAVPELPEGWPDAEEISELVATAALLRGDPARALTLFAVRPAHRHLQAVAALSPSSASWWAAAVALRDQGAWQDCEARAMRDAPAGLRYWGAVWALEDNRDARSYWRAAFPEPPPQRLIMDCSGWEKLAQCAEASGAAEAAERGWREVSTLDPTNLEAPARWAERAEERADLRSALAALQVLVSRQRGSRWITLCEISRLQQALGEPGIDALIEAVEGDCLHPEAYERALKVGEQTLPEPVKRRWIHVHGVLTGARQPSPPPVDSLDAEALDALHPGGVGWLERTRHSLDISAPPARSELVRGLEKISPSEWPRLHKELSALSDALRMSPPEVYLFRGEGAVGLSAWPTDPPLILVGYDHFRDSPVKMEPAALRFALAVELVHLAAKHPLLAFDGGVVGTSRSVYKTFGSYAGAVETFVDVVTLVPGIDQLAKLQTLIRLSRKVVSARTLVDKAAGMADKSLHLVQWATEDAEVQAVGRSFDGPALQFRLQADRAALQLTGDLGAALDAILLSELESAACLSRLHTEGLAAVLDRVDPDTRVRLASLVSFAV